MRYSSATYAYVAPPRSFWELWNGLLAEEQIELTGDCGCPRRVTRGTLLCRTSIVNREWASTRRPNSLPCFRLCLAPRHTSPSTYPSRLMRSRLTCNLERLRYCVARSSDHFVLQLFLVCSRVPCPHGGLLVDVAERSQLFLMCLGPSSGRRGSWADPSYVLGRFPS